METQGENSVLCLHCGMSIVRLPEDDAWGFSRWGHNLFSLDRDHKAFPRPTREEKYHQSNQYGR